MMIAPTGKRSSVFSRVLEEVIAPGLGQSDDMYSMSLEQFADEVLDLPLWSKQREVFRSVDQYRRTTVRSCHHSGKGLALDTPIPTPSGWTTMGALRSGDEVLDERGQPARVSWVSETHELPCWRVTFGDGSSLVADRDHQWSVLTFAARARVKGRLGGAPDWRTQWDQTHVMTTPEMAGSLATAWGQRNLSIPVAMPLRLPDADLPISPYTLGAWLGDGTSSTGAITKPDADLFAMIEEEGWTVGPWRGPGGMTRRIEGLTTALRKAGVLDNKHIPPAYFRASERQRRALLAGILDTDGFAGNGSRSVGIDLCNERLARDVVTLVRTLGMIARINEGHVVFNGKRIARWRITFSADRQVFRLSRKQSYVEVGETGPGRSSHHMIVSVEPVETVPTRCIAVESERRLYLAGEGMVPTHNSSGIARLAVAYLQTHPHSIVLTTAPNATQVREIMWRNIRTAYEKAKRPLAGKRGHPLQTKWEIGADWFALGVSPGKNSSGLQGYHADDILIIVDEAAGVDDAIFEQIEGLMTSEGARLLIIGNPTSVAGAFRRSFHEGAAIYNTITISAEDTPNFAHFGITRQDIETGAWREKVGTAHMPYRGLASVQWAAELVELNGPNHVEVTSRVWAEWPTGGSFTLIPLSAIERADGKEATPEDMQEMVHVGIDVARFGDDETVIWVRQGEATLGYMTMTGMDTVEIVGLFWEVVRQLGLKQDSTEVRIDTTGVGGGVKDTLKAQGWYTKGVWFGAASAHPEQFASNVDEYWWQLKTRFDEDRISFPGGIDGIVRSQLSDIHYSYGNRLRPVIEPKAARKKRSGRSPDRAEAAMLAYANNVRDEQEGKTPKVKLSAMAGMVGKSGTFQKGRGR